MANKLLKKIRIVAPLVLAMTSLTAYAADLPLPIVIDQDTITRWVISIGNFMIEAGVILGVMVIVYSGVRWMMAGADTKASGDAQAILKSGIIGVAVILGVGLIIKTISSLILGSFFG